MGKNIVTVTQERIAELKAHKAGELARITGELEKASQDYEAACKELQNATENTDFKAFGEAKKKQLEAKNKKDMYSQRYDQLKKRELISEEESDKVIDSLLDYEKALAEDYEIKVTKIVEELEAIHTEYRDRVAATENTIKSWTAEVHANYRSNTTIYKETGTNRAPYPVPVRNIPYVGCKKSESVDKFIEAAKRA